MLSGRIWRDQLPTASRDGAGRVDVVVLVVLVAALFVPMPWRFAPPWVGAVQDLAHLPLFAAVAWLMQRITGCRTLIAAVAALCLAVAAELLQTFVGRSSSLADAARGAAGIVLFVVWRVAGQVAPLRRCRLARAACAAIAASWPVAHAWPVLVDAAASWREFPVLADFATRWEDQRWSAHGCRLRCEPGPEGQGDGLLTCAPGGPAEPALILFPIRRDWSSWKFLQMEFTVQDGPLSITVSLRDGRRVSPPRRRFDRQETFHNGRRRVSIDLGEVARGAGEVAPVDVAAVESFHIIVAAERAGHVVRLHRIWLE